MSSVDYIERREHGSPDFPIQYYFVDETHPRYVMNTHWHREFEIIRVRRGSFDVHLNNAEYCLNAGDSLLVGSKSMHTGQPQDCVYECIVFDLNMLSRQQNDAAEKYIAPIMNEQVKVNSQVSRQDAAVCQAIDELFTSMEQQGPCYELEVFGLLYRLFARLYACGYFIPCTRSTTGHQVQVIGELLEWIESNYSEPIALDQLCELTGLSKNYLCRIFKAYTAKTIVEYINERRVESACFELLEKNKSITEVAFDSGFNDFSYFCKVFKRYKGITPKEFKTGQKSGRRGVFSAPEAVKMQKDKIVTGL